MTVDLLEALSYSLKLKELEISYEIRVDYKPLSLFFSRNKSVEIMKVKKIKVYDRFEFLAGCRENNVLKHLFFELLRTDVDAVKKDSFFSGFENHTL